MIAWCLDLKTKTKLNLRDDIFNPFKKTLKGVNLKPSLNDFMWRLISYKLAQSISAYFVTEDEFCYFYFYFNESESFEKFQNSGIFH